MKRPLDEERLAPASVAALDELSEFQELDMRREMFQEEGVEGWHLSLLIPSPAGPDRDVTLWVEGGTELSLGFGRGGWHTHVMYCRELGGDRYREETIAAAVAAILRDEIVLVADEIEGEEPRFESILDLRASDALLDELTSPYGSGVLLLTTFSGTGDRRVTASGGEFGATVPR